MGRWAEKFYGGPITGPVMDPEARRALADLDAMRREYAEHRLPNSVHPRYLVSEMFGEFLPKKYYGFIIEKSQSNVGLNLAPGLYSFASPIPRGEDISDEQLRALIDNPGSHYAGYVEIKEESSAEPSSEEPKVDPWRAANKQIVDKNVTDHGGTLQVWNRRGKPVPYRGLFGAVMEE